MTIGERRPGILWIAVLAALLAGAAGAAQAPSGAVPAVHVVPIEGTIDEGLAVFVRRAVAEAEAAGAAAILVEINTFGGRVDSATDIRDALLRTHLTVIAFIPDRAWSAGALIALAADHIAMAPGASMGAAEPRPADEKTISALRSEFEATAQAHGRDPMVAAAMVDERIEIEGLVAAGEILTLTARKAEEMGFIDLLAGTRAEVLSHFGLAGARLQEAEMNWAERLARFLSEPTISSILLTLGFLGLLTEITTPGWGVPGTAGIIALALFFGARMLTGLAGLEVIILFAVGLGLLLLEMLVIPGFGVAGLLGIAAILASLFLSFPDIWSALAAIGFAALFTVVGAVFILRRVPRSRLWRKLALETSLDHPGFERDNPEDPVIKAGAAGRALSPLRPAGTVQIGPFRIDAVSDGAFIEPGAAVEIVRVVGTRVTVRQIPDGPGGPEGVGKEDRQDGPPGEGAPGGEKDGEPPAAP